MMSAPDKRASTNQSKIQVNVAAAYKKDATLVDIFDGHVQPGREFLDLILSFYKVPSIKTIPFYKADGRQCNIVRHEKNSRRQEIVLATYVASVKSKGIIKGVRGEAWMLAPASEDGAYQALTFGTLTEAFYRAMDQIGDDKHSYPDLCHTASAGLDAVVLDHRTPDSILEFLITYHNAFHKGSTTSFTEMLQKIPDVERAWSVHKLQNHIQARNSDYEAKYREFLQQQYPETWTSYRVFENTRVLYNHVTRLGVLSTFNLQCSKYCDFLDPELSQETTITIMKEIIATCAGGFGALVTREQQVVALELLLLCVPMELPSHKWLFKKTASSSQAAVLLTEVDGKVFDLQNKLKMQKDKKKHVKDPEKMLAEDSKKTAAKAAAKAKGRGKGKATKVKAKPAQSIVDDPTTTTSQVTMEGPTGSLARNKYFIDCMILGARSAFRAARARFGDLPGMDEVSDYLTDALDPEPDNHDSPMSYETAELPLLRNYVRSALLFAFSGEASVGGKIHRRWSSCRPALQTALISAYQEAGKRSVGRHR